MIVEPLEPPPTAPIRVLLVQADNSGHGAIRDLLDAAPQVRFTLQRAEGVAEGMTRLCRGDIDICLLDPAGAGGKALELVQLAHSRNDPAPIVMISDGGSLELDLQAMNYGVSDFLDKRRLDPTSLERTIRCALIRQRRAERLARLAQFDDLTGLANRSLFHDRLERALAAARRRERLVAVMVLDLNGFKAINDRMGHAAGDRLLAIVAKRCARRLRETDTVARLGGDEFGLVIENLAKPEHAALVARKVLDAVAPTAVVDDQEVQVTASLGVALYPRDGDAADGLVAAADRAMYRAKTEGGNLCRFANDRLERRVQRGALLESDLRRGLDHGEFVLHFQPQVGLGPAMSGIATLLRWCHPQLGLIGPDRFLPLAEDGGMLEALTEWLLDGAFRQARQWQEAGLGGDLRLALPLLSRQQLAWSGLAKQLDDRIRRLALAPGTLEIELGEDVLLADVEAGSGGLGALKDLGVRLALDGYGRGPTSLKGLQLGILDSLKLARELLQGVPDEPSRTALASAIITLARELGLRVVAEGIDREDQLAFVRRRGCTAVQSFMTCPPLPAEACTSWLRQAAGQGEPVRAAAPILDRRVEPWSPLVALSGAERSDPGGALRRRPAPQAAGEAAASVAAGAAITRLRPSRLA